MARYKRATLVELTGVEVGRLAQLADAGNHDAQVALAHLRESRANPLQSPRRRHLRRAAMRAASRALAAPS